MKRLKLLLPALVMEAVLGVGLSLTYLAFHGNHKAAKIAVVVVGFAAWVAWMWTAFKVGVFRRRVVTSIAAASSGASSCRAKRLDSPAYRRSSGSASAVRACVPCPQYRPGGM
jgi:hypothetical protein